MDLVSIVIPCYNPGPFLLDAIASAQAQTYPCVETILIDDGTDASPSKEVLATASSRVSRLIEQPNRGPSAARNAGVREARGSFIVPLDCDDLLDPDFVSACLAAIQRRSDAAFAYTDYRVFGDRNYIERLPEYNLYHLLERNTLTYAALVRRQDWLAAGGYDESLVGYEDWEFWLRLGSRGRFGHHLGRPLFRYRKHGRSLSDFASEHHEERVAQIRSKHPELYSHDGYASVKAHWEPAICLAGAAPPKQTICDIEQVASLDCRHLLEASRAGAFLIPPAGAMDEQSAELGALAVWGRNECVWLPDGSLAAPRRALERRRLVSDLKAGGSLAGLRLPPLPRRSPVFLQTVWRHFLNSELLSLDAWLRHPLRSALRLIPLRIKEEVNRLAGRVVFDLSFYSRFQPRSLMLGDALAKPLRYVPRLDSTRRRIALVTPHLGPGGAESVLLEIAGSLDRVRYEILLIATQSHDARWAPRWREHADRIYDLQALVSPERLTAAIYSIVTNWRCDALLVQNSLPGYSIVPQLRKEAPGMRIIDVVHAVHDQWDLASCAAAVGGGIDIRVVISQSGREHLQRLGVPGEKIRLIRNGIHLERFTPDARPSTGRKRILFAARLDPVKCPLLLVDIARALLRLRPQRDFRFVVAGDGSEGHALRARIHRARMSDLFELLGHVEDMAPVLAESDLLIVPSKGEGIPLSLLEACAAGKPVIASRVGAIFEALDGTNGVLIEPSAREDEAFAAAIHRLLEDPRLRQEMGLRGRRRVEAQYDRVKAGDAYRDLFA